jgi:CheY-like chemotaxis protein
MARVRLLHWKASEAAPLLTALHKAGHSVEYEEQFSSALMKQWRRSPPDLFVIDVSRLPSHGREVAIAIRQSPATRRTPIVFCGGEEQKVERLRSLMPDAVYCAAPSKLGHAVKVALETPIADAVVPVAMMDRYRDRTAAEKLGIKEGSTLAVMEGPPHLEKLLGQIPAAVQVVDGEADVTLCCVHDGDSVRQTFSDMRDRAGKSKLWMLWLKKTSDGHRGVTESVIREAGLSLGLVDYKICSVNQDWSAMLFARKKASAMN